MRKLCQSVVMLLVGTVLLGLPSAGGTKSDFTNIWKTYKIPIKVSEHAALLDFGMEAVYDFARKQQSSKSWIYAYESSLDRDPETGKFTSEKAAGEDRFVRYFGEEKAEMMIQWKPLEKGDESLKASFSEITEGFEDIFKSAGRKIQRVGKVEESKIGGYPAMGIKYKIAGGQSQYVTFWLARSEGTKRWYMLVFYYTSGFTEPSGSFAKVKQGIVFLKPEK